MIRKAELPRTGAADDVREFIASGWECAEVVDRTQGALWNAINRNPEFAGVRVTVRNGKVYLVRVGE